MQRQAALAITRAYQLTPQRILLIGLGLESLETQSSKAKLVLFFKIKNNVSPEYLSNLLPKEVGETVHYGLRNSQA